MPMPGLIQPGPENADEIVRAGREVEKFVRAHAVVEHSLIMPEPGQGYDADNLPCALRRR